MFYLACTRFDDKTWIENINYKEKEKMKGVIYGVSIKINEKFSNIWDLPEIFNVIFGDKVCSYDNIKNSQSESLKETGDFQNSNVCFLN